jgi:hypothetical protein
MPGLKFTTNLDAESLFKSAFRRAQDQGYTVRATGDRAFAATSGNMALSVLAVSSYCDFRVSVEKYDDGNELVLERNSPWLLGAVGVGRVKSKAQELFKNLKDEVAQRGGQIRNEKEF